MTRGEDAALVLQAPWCFWITPVGRQQRGAPTPTRATSDALSSFLGLGLDAMHRKPRSRRALSSCHRGRRAVQARMVPVCIAHACASPVKHVHGM